MSTFDEGATLEERAGDPSALVTRYELLSQLEMIQLGITSMITSLSQNDAELLNLINENRKVHNDFVQCIVNDFKRVVTQLENLQSVVEIQQETIGLLIQKVLALEENYDG